MDISLLFKIAAVGILVSILSQVLKHSGREEQAFLTSWQGFCWFCSGLCRTSMICLSRSGGCFHCKSDRKEGEGIWI